MNSIELTDFRQLVLVGDIKYLRFVEKKSNKLYLVEYYTDTPIEVTMENIKKLSTMEEVRNYFINLDSSVNIFEFIESRDIKRHLSTIKNMTVDEKKMLTQIVKEIKTLNINYINFTYFFVETQDSKLYYAKLNKKTGVTSLKNLKIEMVIKPADINTIIRDINAYGAFKYHNMTIKYDEIKEYIDNPLLNPKKELSWVIDNIRDYESSRRVQERVKEKKEIEENKKDSTVDETKPIDSIKDLDVKSDIKEKKSKTKKKKKKDGFKGSLLMYCLIGFTAGVLLAAITIVIGSII